MDTRSARQRWQRTGQVAIHAVLILICILFVLPFLYMFLASFKPALEIIKMPPTFFPKKFTLINYQTIFERLKFWRYFLNSIITSGASRFWPSSRAASPASCLRSSSSPARRSSS